MGAVGLATAILLPLLGGTLLRTVGGGAYVAAWGALMIMGAAAVVEMTGSALEPTLFALGRGGAALRGGVASAVVTVTLMVPLTIAGGAWGAAWAVLTGSVTSFTMMGWSVARGMPGTRMGADAGAEPVR